MDFPRDYFMAEEREGFFVPEMMKRAWAAELEVLEVIKEVCQKCSVRYFAFYGTLLGAVRHKGFIPWDDDIDICMLREDYDRFMMEAENYLPDGFVISGIYGKTPRLWEANKQPQGRVMVDEQIYPIPTYMTRFHGFPYLRVGVDIFPLDFFPDDREQQYHLVKMCNDIQFLVANWEWHKEKGLIVSKIKDISAKLAIPFEDIEDESNLQRQLLFEADRLIADAEKTGTSKVGDVLYARPGQSVESYVPIRGLDSEWFEEGVEVPFEHTHVMIPKHYENVLERTFGADYMTPQKFTVGHTYPFYKYQEEAFVKLLRESGVETDVNVFCRNWHNLAGGR